MSDVQVNGRIVETRVAKPVPVVSWDLKLATIKQYVEQVAKNGPVVTDDDPTLVTYLYESVELAGFEYVDPRILKLEAQKAWNAAKKAKDAADKIRLAELEAKFAALARANG